MSLGTLGVGEGCATQQVPRERTAHEAVDTNAQFRLHALTTAVSENPDIIELTSNVQERLPIGEPEHQAISGLLGSLVEIRREIRQAERVLGEQSAQSVSASDNHLLARGASWMRRATYPLEQLQTLDDTSHVRLLTALYGASNEAEVSPAAVREFVRLTWADSAIEHQIRTHELRNSPLLEMPVQVHFAPDEAALAIELFRHFGNADHDLLSLTFHDVRTLQGLCMSTTGARVISRIINEYPESDPTQIRRTAVRIIFRTSAALMRALHTHPRTP